MSIIRTSSGVVSPEVETVDGRCWTLNFGLPWASLPVILPLVLLLRRLRGQLAEDISKHVRKRHQLLLPLLLRDDFPTVLHNKLHKFALISTDCEPRWETTFMTRGLSMSVEWRSASMRRSRQFEMLTDWQRTSSHFLFRCFRAYWNIFFKQSSQHTPPVTWSEAARSLSLFSSMFSIFPP